MTQIQNLSSYSVLFIFYPQVSSETSAAAVEYEFKVVQYLQSVSIPNVETPIALCPVVQYNNQNAPRRTAAVYTPEVQGDITGSIAAVQGETPRARAARATARTIIAMLCEGIVSTDLQVKAKSPKTTEKNTGRSDTVFDAHRHCFVSVRVEMYKHYTIVLYSLCVSRSSPTNKRAPCSLLTLRRLRGFPIHRQTSIRAVSPHFFPKLQHSFRLRFSPLRELQHRRSLSSDWYHLLQVVLFTQSSVTCCNRASGNYRGNRKRSGRNESPLIVASETS